jgi:hypothetical protein
VVALSPIVGRYLRSWFIIDFVSTVPLASIKGLKVVRIIRLTRLLKLLRLLRLSALAKKADAMIDVLGIPALMVRVVGIVTKLLLIAHLTACLWWSVAQLEVSHNTPSFAKLHVTITSSPSDFLDVVNVGIQYIIVLYFSLVTMFGIGYGPFRRVVCDVVCAVCAVARCACGWSLRLHWRSVRTPSQSHGRAGTPVPCQVCTSVHAWRLCSSPCTVQVW